MPPETLTAAAGGTHGCSSWAMHIWAAARRRGGRLPCSNPPPKKTAALPGQGSARPRSPAQGAGWARSLLPRGPGEWPRLRRIYRGGRRWPGWLHLPLPLCPPPGAGDWSGRSRCDRLAPGITCGGAGPELEPEPEPGWAGLGTAERSRGGHGSSAVPSQPRAPPATAEKGPAGRPPRRRPGHEVGQESRHLCGEVSGAPVPSSSPRAARAAGKRRGWRKRE